MIVFALIIALCIRFCERTNFIFLIVSLESVQNVHGILLSANYARQMSNDHEFASVTDMGVTHELFTCRKTNGSEVLKPVDFSNSFLYSRRS